MIQRATEISGAWRPAEARQLDPGDVPGTSRRRRRGSMTGLLARVLIVLTLVPFLPLVYLSWMSFQEEVAGLEREIEASNRHIALLAAGSLETMLRLVAREARLAGAGRPDGLIELPEELEEVRWELVDPSGAVLRSEISTARIGQPSGYESLAGLLEPGAAELSSIGRWVRGEPPTAVVLSRPEGRDLVLAGVLDPAVLHNRLQALSGDELDRHLYVIDRTGELLFYSDLTLSDQGADLRSNPPIRAFIEGHTGPMRYLSVVSGKERLGHVHLLKGHGWGVVVSADDGERLLVVRDRYLAVGLSIVFALIVAVLILLWTSRRLGAPVLDIIRSLQAPDRAHCSPLPVRGSTRSIREYDLLVQAFDELGSEVAAIERELVQTSRSATLGQLASGLAHEMGTPLNVISGNAQLLARKLSPDDPSRRALDQIAEQSRRITRMIRRLLDLSRPIEMRLIGLDPGAVARQALEMVPAASRQIEVRTEIASGLPHVLADPKMLEHALINLLVNACQAMASGGLLTLRVMPWTDASTGRGAARQWVAFEVEDTGCGIGEGELDRIFEPFFTSKPHGQGTGLGLAIVDRIIKLHRGRLEVRSRPGRGATFRALLEVHCPAAPGETMNDETMHDEPERHD